MNKAFQKRWFVLKGNLLFYFERKGDKDPIGVIVLEGCTVELAESADAYTFELGFQGSGSRTYVIAATTQEEMESWMKAITCAGYDYMRLMVAELQRQLDEVNIDQNNFTSGWVVDGADSTESCQRRSKANVVNRRATSAMRQSKGQAMLVDLSEAEPEPQSRQNSRQNPFNHQDDGLDLFGATAFKPTGPTRARTFEEMHNEFGDYILKKIRQHSLSHHS